jgi:hypothetical protein
MQVTLSKASSSGSSSFFFLLSSFARLSFPSLSSSSSSPIASSSFPLDFLDGDLGPSRADLPLSAVSIRRAIKKKKKMMRN